MIDNLYNQTIEINFLYKNSNLTIMTIGKILTN